jgi:hypothetical protein
MSKVLYRVEILSTSDQEILNTKGFNYGNSFDTNYYDYFRKVYGNIMEKVNIPIDVLVLINNNIYTLGSDYGQKINAAINGEFLDIFKLTQNSKHIGYHLHVDFIDEFLQSFDEDNQFIFFDNGTFLWEYYLEKVRSEEFKHLPKRMVSTFFFDNIESCNYYKNNHLNGIGQIKNIELVETKKTFEGDMNIIDAIENSISRDELLETIRKYWRGEKSDNPITEIVFQGEFRFLN